MKCNRKLTYKTLKSSIDIDKIRLECNFLTVKQRVDYVILKNAFKRYKEGNITFTDRSIDLNMTMPKIKMNVNRVKSETYKNSVHFRTTTLWNTLPKNWVLSEMSYGVFCSLTKDFILKKKEIIHNYRYLY
jgi:hypothetical protein